MIRTDTSLFERAVARITNEGPRPLPLVPAPIVVARPAELVEPPARIFRVPDTMLASAADIRIGSPQAERDLRGTRQGWQARAWAMYAELGIVWFAVEWGANALSRHRLIAARQRKPGDEPEPVEPDSFPQQLVDDLGRGVPTPQGQDGNAALMHDLGTCLRCPGECYLLGQDGDGTYSTYDIVSTDEVQLQGGRLIRRRWPGAPPEHLDPATTLLKRIWKPDAQWSALATSPLKSALSDLERLSLLKAGGMAALRSRVALAGLFTIPSEIEFPQVDPDEPPPTFDQILMAAMETSVQDAKSIGRFVPLILKAKAEFLKPDVLRKITLYDPAASERDSDEAEAIVRQFALEIDLPPEVLLGLGDMNHWSAWKVSEDAKEAIRPTVELAVMGLTYTYLRPALEAARWPNPDEWVVWFDDSDFGVDRDRVEDAGAAHDRLIISDAAYRRATNWQEDDAPGEDERRRRIAIKVGDAGAALGGESTGATRSESAPGVPSELPTARPPQLPTLVPPAITGATTNGASRAVRLRTLARQLAAVDRELMTRLVERADAAVQRAAARAGAKIRSSLAGNGKRATLATILKHTDNVDLTRELTKTGMLATLQIEQDWLFDGVGAAFIREVRPMVAEAQEDAVRRTARALDMNEAETVEQTSRIRAGSLERALAVLERGFELVAVSHVMREPQTPTQGEVSSLVAPRGAIRRALALAGGSSGATVGALTGAALEATLGAGPLVAELLESRGAHFGSGFVWDYTGIARSTFPGHLMLDNETFAGPDDENLQVHPDDAWLGVTHYAPGDHEGCCCLTQPTIEEVPPPGGTEEEPRVFSGRDDADSWVREHFADWDPGKADGLAIDRYRGIMYQRMNSTLRGGQALDAEMSGITRRLDSVIERTKLPEPVRAYRGMNHELGQMIKRGDDVIGTIIEDQAYVSTTLLEDVAHGFTGSGPRKLLVEIELPKGMGVAPIEARQAGEYEMLLGRGKRFRVKAAEFVDTDVRRYSKITVEVID